MLIYLRRFLSVATAVAVAAVCALPSAEAQVMAPVQASGDVTPIDNPFTTEINEGIIHWRPNLGSIFDPPGTLPFQDEYAFNSNIVVGQNSYGIVLINDNEQVRYDHLILGGTSANANSNTEIMPDLNAGYGVVRIEGFGTLFNNDPSVLPPNPIGALVTANGWDDRPTSMGFDVYVGLTGSGTLEVFDGGRMEIQDALIVGFAESSSGAVTVDGFSSYINVAGSGDTTGSGGITDGQIHHLAIGPIGTGVMTIRNGGKVDARTGVSIGTLGTDGSNSTAGTVGGGIEIDDDVRQPSGTLTVDGLDSRLRVIGGFAIGAYDENTTDYEENDGAGTLVISNDALVTIDAEEDTSGFGNDRPADIVVGRFGRILLEDGTLLAGGNLTSHGVIEGDGHITVATVLNQRVLGGGSIIVGADQSLVIRTAGPDTILYRGEEFYGANTGIVEVTGGIFEYDRLVDTTDPDTRFENLFFPETFDDPMTPLVDESGPEEDGTFVVRNGTVRFRSGLVNFGVMGFTSGDNLLSADTINEVGGRLVFTGNSNTTIDDDLLNMGQIHVGQDSTLTVLGDLTLSVTAALSLTLSNQELVSNLPQGYIATSGDIELGGLLDVNAPIGGIFNPMPGDSFLLMSTTGTITGIFDALDFSGIMPLSNPGWSWLLDNTGQDLLLTVTDIMPIGADFNGDGIVDAADIAIWQMFFGIDMGATGVMGDADGDGDVDVHDFLIIQMQLGGPGMGALVGNDPTNGGAVPEPSTLLLLTGLAALAAVRRVKS